MSEATKRRYQRSYADWRIPAALDAGTGLQGGGGGGGIHVGVNQDGHVFAGPSRESLHYQSRRRRNQDLHFERQMQDSMNGSHLAHTAPAIFNSPLARDTSRLREALQRSKAYTSTNDYSPRHRNKSWLELQILSAFVKTPPSPAYRDNRSYFSKLRTALLTAHIPQNDIRTIWSDVWFRTANEWQTLPHEEHLKLIGECWEVYDVQDKIYQGRANLEDYRYLLDTPAERFMDNVAIPLLTVGSMFTPATAPAALAGVARTAVAVTPRLMQVATALGATEVCREMMTFFSKKAGGDPGKKSDPAPRVQNTRTDADNYIKGLTDQKNLILNRGKTKDGYHYYEVMQNFEYKGIRFRRGDYVSRDTQHHEIEWFRGANNHRGAIDPVKGNLYKPADPGRTLKIK